MIGIQTSMILLSSILIIQLSVLDSFIFSRLKSRFEPVVSTRLYNDSNIKDVKEEEMERKLAWAKHTILSVAASIMNVPSDVFTTPPMLDPIPPTTPEECIHRDKINRLLNIGYPNQLDGFEIPTEEIHMMNEVNNSHESTHNPETYGEVTQLGARQLFYYMKMFNNDKIHFIDLGSGNGKLVVQAYLEIPFLMKAQGIELSPARHNHANKSWDNIKGEANELRTETIKLHRTLSETNNQYQNKDTKNDTVLNLVQGDLFEMDISTATHIYVASLCFTDEMMNALSTKIMTEGKNLQYVATLKQFSIEIEKVGGFIKESRYVEMTWTKPRGMGGVVYFYSKK